MFLNLNVKLFHKALYYITPFLSLVSGHYAAHCFKIHLPALFIAVVLPTIIRRFPII
jgi:hypothetical protein